MSMKCTAGTQLYLPKVQELQPGGNSEGLVVDHSQCISTPHVPLSHHPPREWKSLTAKLSVEQRWLSFQTESLLVRICSKPA